MADFTINGVAYQSKMIDGQKQIHVMKRLLPAFTALAGVATGLVRPELVGGEEPAPDTERLAFVLAPVARELAALSDDDVDFVLNACLDVTSRRLAVGVGWAPVRQNGFVQDQADSRFVTRLSIAWNVIGENFADMFASFGIDVQSLMGRASG